MTEKFKDTKTTEKKSLKENDKGDERKQQKDKKIKTYDPLEELMKIYRKVPHPGTVRVTVLPNPRVNKRVPADKDFSEESG